MADGLIYAFGALVAFGIGDLVYKRGAAAGAPAHHFLMVQSWVYGPIVALYAAATGTWQFSTASLWGAAAGFFAFTGFYNFARCLQDGAISLLAPVFRLSFLVTALLAVALLGEPLTGAKSAGIALGIAATWLLLGGNASSGGARLASGTLLRVLGATACVGIGNLLYAVGTRAGATPGSIIVVQACVVITLGTGFAILKDGRLRPSALAVRHAPRAALVLAFGFAFMVEAIARIQTSVAVPISQMGFLVTAVLGFAFLREPFSLRKGAGILAALAALGLLALQG